MSDHSQMHDVKYLVVKYLISLLSIYVTQRPNIYCHCDVHPFYVIPNIHDQCIYPLQQDMNTHKTFY